MLDLFKLSDVNRSPIGTISKLSVLPPGEYYDGKDIDTIINQQTTSKTYGPGE